MSLQDSHQISDVKVMLMKGIDGKGIASIEKTSSQGLVDVYTITYTDGTKSTFTVTNGAGGGMSAMFLITSEAGSEISVSSPTGRPLDVTQVSGSSTQWMSARYTQSMQLISLHISLQHSQREHHAHVQVVEELLSPVHLLTLLMFIQQTHTL